MRRREFLKRGAAGAVASLGLLAGSSGIPEVDLKAAAAGLWLSSPLSVGYWDRAASSRVVDASSLSLGDSSFVRTGARVRFEGLRSASGDTSFDGLTRFSVDVAYRPYNDVTFLAWILDNSGFQKASSSLSPVVPIASTSGLNLVIGLQMVGSAAQQVPVTLLTRSGLFAPKLRDGVYFIGVSESSGAGVNWSSFQARPGDNGTMLVPSSGGGRSAYGASSELTYFVFDVSHAG